MKATFSHYIKYENHGPNMKEAFKSLPFFVPVFLWIFTFRSVEAATGWDNWSDWSNCEDATGQQRRSRHYYECKDTQAQVGCAPEVHVLTRIETQLRPCSVKAFLSVMGALTDQMPLDCQQGHADEYMYIDVCQHDKQYTDGKVNRPRTFCLQRSTGNAPVQCQCNIQSKPVEISTTLAFARTNWETGSTYPDVYMTGPKDIMRIEDKNSTILATVGLDGSTIIFNNKSPETFMTLKYTGASLRVSIKCAPIPTSPSTVTTNTPQVKTDSTTSATNSSVTVSPCAGKQASGKDGVVLPVTLTIIFLLLIALVVLTVFYIRLRRQFAEETGLIRWTGNDSAKPPNVNQDEKDFSPYAEADFREPPSVYDRLHPKPGEVGLSNGGFVPEGASAAHHAAERDREMSETDKGHHDPAYLELQPEPGAVKDNISQPYAYAYRKPPGVLPVQTVEPSENSHPGTDDSKLDDSTEYDTLKRDDPEYFVLEEEVETPTS